MALQRWQCCISIIWMLPKARISFFPAILFILFSLLQVPSATPTSLKGQKAVFRHSNITNEYWTLSPGTKIPSLQAFTLCVDIRLKEMSANGVAVFTYNTDKQTQSAALKHELSIMVESKYIVIWLFRKSFRVKKILPLHTWHSLCLTWNSQSHTAQIYVNGTLEDDKKQGKKILGQNGSLVLGRRHRRLADRLQVDLEMAFVGELYLFRLWDHEKSSRSIANLNCEDGNIITWDREQWAFTGTILEDDTTLSCCENCFKLRFKHSATGSTDSMNTTVTTNTLTSITTDVESTTTPSENITGNNTDNQTLSMMTVPPNTTATESTTTLSWNSTKAETGNNNGEKTRETKPTKTPGNGNPPPRQTTAERSTYAVTTQLQNTAGSSTYTATTQLQNTPENSTYTATTPLQNTAESSTYTATSQLQNTTGNNTATLTSRPQFTADVTIINVTKPSHNITDVIIINATKPSHNITESSTYTATTQLQNTTGNNTATLPPHLQFTKDVIIINVTKPSHNITDSAPSEPTTTLNITALDEAAVAAIVSQLEEVLQMEAISTGLAMELIGRISALLSASPDVVASFSTRLIRSVDTIGLRLNFTTESVNITSSSLALAVSKVNGTGFGGADFRIRNITNLQVSLDEGTTEENFAAIKLPSSLLNNLTSEDQEIASRVQFTFYERATLFQDPSMENTTILNSYIIGASVANLSIANLMDPVRILFRNIEPTENDTYVQCVFWDFSKNNGSGGWNSDGCTTESSSSNQTICECDHLTHFGILLALSRDFNIDAKNNQILTFITYIGCGLSSILLAVTLVTYLAFDKLRRDYPSKILINLCAALLLLNMTFLIDSWISVYNIDGLCIAVAVLLHYFLLVSFTWMSLEAFHMYLALVKVFNTYVHRYMLKFSIIGWGIPIIVIAIVLIISPNNYGLGDYDKNTNSTYDTFCWINDDTTFYVAVVAYFCVMFLLNVSIFIVVMIQFCRIKNQKQHKNTERNVLQDMKSVAGLTFLLGITWGFAFFAWEPVNIPFMYLFAIFNTLQGAFIFAFHCLSKENVQKQWRRYLCCGKLRLAENSDWSRTATNNTKKLQPLVQAISLSSTSNSSLQSNSSLFLVQEYGKHPKMNGAKF
ncbi:adhesion G-protein coupled receptor G2-like isoform X4 [Leucoraja erinacea]|uniref:adhesion G-protein coupled receptor G2-like isoform X4 n=1 Tax=Leucoraja erinaceus TaxID=7782 RepID=UPI0024577ECD|nr:adhesion G-protein coupled receptor G2-like isoform X4 [Leucoraja erinacea]